MGVYIDGTPLETFQAMAKDFHDSLKREADKSSFRENLLVAFNGMITSVGATLTLFYVNGGTDLLSDTFPVKSVDDVFDKMQANNLFICTEIFSSCLIEDMVANVKFFYEKDSYILANFLRDFCSLVAGKNIDEEAYDKFYAYKKAHSASWADGVHISENASEALNSRDEKLEKSFREFIGGDGINFVYNERNWCSDFCVVPLKEGATGYIELDANWNDGNIVLSSFNEPIKEGEPILDSSLLGRSVQIDNCDVSPFVGTTNVVNLYRYIEKYHKVIPALDDFTYDVFRAVVSSSKIAG